MRNLVLPSLIVTGLVSQVAGCVYDDTGGTNDAAAVVAVWSFKNEATQEFTGCPQGFSTVAMHNMQLDAEGSPIVSSDVIDLFDCIDGNGVTDPLFPDVYSTFIEVTDDAGSNVYAQSLSAIVDVVDFDKEFEATILNDGGYFSLSWDLIGAVSNKPVACADTVGAGGGIEAISTSMATGSVAITDQFICEDGFGVTGGLLQGSYTVSINAFNIDGGAIGTAPALATQVIKDRNQVTALDHITIPIDGK